MTASEHFSRAEELAAKASEYLGRGDGQESAAVWAAVAQVHATLAVAAAIEAASAIRETPEIPVPENTPPGAPAAAATA
jgi:hypothetical protein